MNKNLVQFLQQNRFNFDKSCFCGNLKGFQVSGVCVGNAITVTFYVNLNETDIPQVNAWLDTSKRAYALNRITVDTMSISATITAFSTVKKAISFIVDGTNYLATFKAPDCCPICGKPLSQHAAEDVAATDTMNTPPFTNDRGEAKLIGIGSNRLYMHDKCFDDFSAAVANHEAMLASAPNNYLRGTLGALIGCVGGAIIWVLLYFVGYIAVVAAILTSLAASFLWDKFGGKNDGVKILVVWLGTVLIIALAMFLTYIAVGQAAINIAISEYGSSITDNPLEAIKIACESDDSLRTGIIVDTAVSFIFIVVGNIYTTTQILQTQKLLSRTLVKF